MSAYVEDGEKWRGGGEGGVSVLGSLWVSQVLSGRESGRYLIVIASMERTEAGPVRKFLIYLVFLFSLLFLPSPTALFAGWDGGEARGGVGVLCARTGGKWRKGMRSLDESEGGKNTASSSPKFSFCP